MTIKWVIRRPEISDMCGVVADADSLTLAISLEMLN
jgi:hypothetical protein